MGVLLGSSVGRNLGLVVALIMLCLVGIATAGEQFASIDNGSPSCDSPSVIGVVSVGMTFVITGGGIDLSVGAIVALSSVWATTLATQSLARGNHWTVMVLVAAARRPGLRADQRPAGRVRRGGALHRHTGHAGRRPWPRRDHRPAPDPDRERPRLHRLLPTRRRSASRCWSSSSRWSRSSGGSCSTAPRSAVVPSRSAATPRLPAWPASTSSGTPSPSTPSSGCAAASPR